VDPEARVLEPFHEEDPICKIGINQQIKVGELAKKRGMSNPGDCHLAVDDLWEVRGAAGSGPRCKPPLPNHFVEERPRVKVFAWSQFLKRPRNAPFPFWRPCTMIQIHCNSLHSRQFRAAE